MKNKDTKKTIKTKSTTYDKFNPFRVISEEEFCRNMNMNLIIAYSQIIKGETKKRFIAS